jgi:hypothetical protein
MEINLKGPLSTFVIVKQIDNKPYFLNLLTTPNTPGSQNLIYYFESKYTCSNSCSNVSLPIFKSGIFNGEVVFYDTSNNGYLNYDSNFNVLFGSSPQGINVNETINSVKSWGPGIFLASIEYNVLGGDEPLGVETGDSGSLKNYTMSNLDEVFFLPSTMFLYEQGSCSEELEVNTVISNYFCTILGKNDSSCNGNPPFTQGWTNQQDCVNAFLYDYCLINQSCGDSNCNGPCVESYDDCDNINNIYKCILNPKEYIKSGKLWKSPYFIAGISVAVVVFLIIFIGIIYFAKKYL